MGNLRVIRLKEEHLPKLNSVVVKQKSAWTIIDKKDNAVVAAIGIGQFVWGTAGETWFEPGPAIDRNAIGTIRITRKQLEKDIKDLNLLCVTAHIDDDKEKNKRFASALGMKHIGNIPKWGDHGQDIALYCTGPKARRK